ncbi:MAG: RecX family transcriptional regulator [Synergistaceae bacterium]|nr:regulatory protein RecX [Synergistota bacterium]NLM70686.1 RecX family transcriptional regulator [Synergistaceae bacterium]
MSRQRDRRRGRSPEDYLVSLLDHSPQTRGVALEKLLRRGVPRDEAEELLDRFEQAGWIDDAAYAVLFVDSHEEWGLRRLRDELAARGVARDLVERALEEVDEEDRAAALVEEWSSLGMERSKMEGRLLRRGFSPSVCRNSLDGAC